MIEFRAWHINYKIMMKVCTLEFSPQAELQFVQLYGPENELYDFNGEEIKKELILMQWTGLVDKKGTKLFEGDVIVFYPPWGAHAHLVERSTSNNNLIVTELYIRTLDPNDYMDLDEINFAAGIIEGNRWNTPELLNMGDNDDTTKQ